MRTSAILSWILTFKNLELWKLPDVVFIQVFLIFTGVRFIAGYYFDVDHSIHLQHGRGEIRSLVPQISSVQILEDTFKQRNFLSKNRH